MNVMRKAVIASAISMAFAGSVHAGSVLIDFNGASQGPNAMFADRFNVTQFQWVSDNLLIRNTTPAGDAPAVSEFYAQALMSSASGFSFSASPSATPSGPVAFSGQWTYQMRVNVGVEAVDADHIKYNPATATSSFFDVFYNPTRISSDVTGCGYGSHQTGACSGFLVADGGAGILVLSGVAKLEQQVTLQQIGTLVEGLDQFNNGPNLGQVDSDNAIDTRTLQWGPASIAIDITYRNPSFVLQNIISITTDINPDLRNTNDGGASFKQANPSDEVVGQDILNNLATTYGSDSINNIGPGSCDNAAPCDVHLQTNSSTSVITDATNVPEPASMVLLGLGLAGLGVASRRRAKRVTAA